jgi:ubiquinone/menaquinone biosynthesis C-methylase UbiE
MGALVVRRSNVSRPACPSEDAQSRPKLSGDEATRSFYDREGWRQVGETSTTDYELFGAKDPGPIQVALHELHLTRLRDAIARAGPSPRVVECGCGGNPERTLMDAASHYTGVDFSWRGLEVARKRLADHGVPHDLVQSDICGLPFPDGAFDIAYSAHVLYHLSDPEAQAAAIREMARIVRPGGLVILILANPRPLLFPLRLLKRLIADMPGVGPALDKLRRKPPLPFKPRKIGWTKRLLKSFGTVEIVGFSMPSTLVMQRTQEKTLLGHTWWRGIQICDTTFPKGSAHLGNYLMYTLLKHD